MIQLDADMLRRLQLTELDLLRELDRICRKHGIRYQIIAGTLLGAVRHGGFIPWDDDADVAMLRGEYERFREACRTELDGNLYCFQDNTCAPGYRWGYGKLRRRETLFLREHQEHMPYEQGVFIDVFPLDAVPEGYVARSLVNFECFCVRKILWSPVGARADRSAVKRWVYRLLERIPEAAVFRHFERMIRRAGTRKSRWVRILMFPTPNRAWGYLRKWYERAEETVFEGCTFPGVRDAEEYLRFKYGDFLELPPEGQRKTHPVSAIRLPDVPGAAESRR